MERIHLTQSDELKVFGLGVSVKDFINISVCMKNRLYKIQDTGRIFLINLFLVAAATIAIGQTISPLEQAMNLNRSGEWEQAAQLMGKFLNEKQWKSGEEQCQAFYSLSYAYVRLMRDTEAQSVLAEYDKSCRNLAASSWISASVKKLREEFIPSNLTPPKDDGFWKTGDPASLGINKSVLDAHLSLCEQGGADACLVIVRGKIVQEYYSQRYRVPMMAMSSTKSITGILFGMLLDDGKIKSLDEPVCNYISEWCAGEKAKVTLRHLLSMTSGLPRIYETGVGSVGDKNPFVINLPLESEPGKAWNYSNEGVQLLSPILDKAAGEPIQDYARRRLFEPLGMMETRLHLDIEKHAWTYADMETTARDFSRIGILMLNKGVWQGRRIVSEKWLGESVKPSQNLNPNYGLLWWLSENPKGFAALGYLDTNLYVFPKQDLIVVRMQSKPIEGQKPYRSSAFPIFEKLVDAGTNK